jgi:hypothetical protein
VIIASSDAEAAVRMIAALNPKRYRVEHIFDLNEALLRAKIVLAHCLVVHIEGVDSTALTDVKQIAERCTPVMVSGDPSIRALAERLGGRFVGEPFEVHTFKRAVYRAVSKTQDKSHKVRGKIRDSGPRQVQRIALLYGKHAQAAVMAAVLRNQLGVSCDVATTPRDVLTMLESGLDCLVADPNLLMFTEDGAALASMLAQRGVPVIPLAGHAQHDVSSAGQAAWDISPHVRRTLTARNKISAAG